MSGWTDEDYRRLGMKPPGKGGLVAEQPAAAPRHVTQTPGISGGKSRVRDAYKDALVRRLREAGVE